MDIIKRRSEWIRVIPNPMKVSQKRVKFGTAQGECQVKMEAEIRVILPQSQELQGL